MQFKDYKNIHQMLSETVIKYRNQQAYRWFDNDGNAESVTWDGFYDQVKTVSKSLMSLGVNKDDKVSILSYTSYKWVLVDMASVCVGMVTIGIYQSNLPEDCKYIINHSDSVVVFAEDENQLEKLFEIRKNIPNVRKVILMNGVCKKVNDDNWVISFEEFLELGKDISDAKFIEQVEAVNADDVASIVYTSGTTGVPKGAMLTNDNLTFTVQSIEACAEFEPVGKREMLLFLPLVHVFARLCSYTAIKIGSRTSFARSIDTLLEDFKLASPNWFVSVPRVFEKIHTKIISGAEAKGGVALKIFNWACAVGAEVSEYKLKKKPIPLAVQIQYLIATKLVFSKIQTALGGNVKWCISGAAPLNPEIAKFFHAAGLLILEGIGMTENTSFTNVNRFDDYAFGVVGPPGPGISQKLDNDGEVLYSGRNVMKGYYKMPEQTAETFTEDGWLRTGDIGAIGINNVLRITGRKKEIIITAGGKNVAPAAIEGMVTTSKYINQICVIGDRRKYLTAIVTLDEENIKAYAKDNEIQYSNYNDLLKNPEIEKLVNSIVEEKNKNLPSFETLKKVTIVPEFTIENAFMTPTFKVKKNVIMKEYNEEINKMYPQSKGESTTSW